MLAGENFGEFVVFGVRAVTELLRQSVEAPVTDRSDLKDGLVYEARLNELDDAARFHEATRLAPAVAELAPAPSPRSRTSSSSSRGSRQRWRPTPGRTVRCPRSCSRAPPGTSLPPPDQA